jgi:hypothetical protein
LGGVQAVRIRIPAASTYMDRALGDTRARTRTGASIVAVLRGEEVIASPGPDFTFRADDVVVAVGHEDGRAKLRDLLILLLSHLVAAVAAPPLVRWLGPRAFYLLAAAPIAAAGGGRAHRPGHREARSNRRFRGCVRSV